MSRATAAYVAPFVVFVLLMSFLPLLGVGPEFSYPARSMAALAVWWVLSRGLSTWRPRQALASVALGVFVFAVWVAPDVLWPGYRQHWLFENALTGAARSTAGVSLRSDLVFLGFRVLGSVLVVPVIEELFWRGWLMRWLVRSDFERVPLGAYVPRAFWVTAVLFGLEHGPYWDVGLAAGVAYNWWVVRTKSLADCVLAHGVTNGCLAGYVLVGGDWSYWL
jgi:CAAX prenyl protease-like protein